MRKSSYIPFLIIIAFISSAFSIKTVIPKTIFFKLETIEKTFLAGTEVALTFSSEKQAGQLQNIYKNVR